MTQLLEFLADKLPTQDQRNLSFASHQPKAFRDWVESLPVVNVGETAKLLYQGVQELCHLKASAAHRLQLLELIRPKIHYTADALKQHYAHQPILLSAKARKVANLCQALQKHLAVGYKVCLINALDGGFLGTAKEHIPTASHRFLSELVFILLRCYQLYHPATPMLWYEIHLVYALAEERSILDHALDDPEIDLARPHTIADLYKKAVILATCKPNQLQSEDMDNVFFGSNDWSTLTTITQDHSRGGLFASALNTDMPPTYVRNIQEQHHHVRYIDMRNVVKYLETGKHSEQKFSGLKAEVRPRDCAHISDALAQHLTSAWARTSKRSNERTPQTGQIEINVGLSDCYEHLCIMQDFNATKPTPSAPEKEAAAEDDFIDMEMAISRRIALNRRDLQLQRYHCKLVNISARGVCLAWQQQLPLQLKNGELVLLRQHDRTDWLLGSISWKRHFHGEGVRTGIHLFAPNMVAVALQHVRNGKQVSTAEGDWLPGILLPPVEIGAKPTLITSTGSGFREGGQAVLNHHGEHPVVFEHVTRQSNGFIEYSFFSQSVLFDQAPTPDNGVLTEETKPMDIDDDLEGLWSEL